jgi:hypothetical protein
LSAIVSLGHQTLEPQHAGMAKQVWTDLATFKVRQEYAVDATRQPSRETCLSHAQWKLPKIVAVAH